MDLGRLALRRPSGFAYGGSIAALKLGLMHLPQRGQETLHTIAGSVPALARKASWQLLGSFLCLSHRRALQFTATDNSESRLAKNNVAR